MNTLQKNFSFLLVSIFGITSIGFISSYTFANSNEFIIHAQKLAEAGIIKYQVDANKYYLDREITRAEIAKISSNLGGLTPQSCTGQKFPDDVNTNLGDLCSYVETLAYYGYIRVKPYFRPNSPVTRAEAVKMLINAGGITAEGAPHYYFDDIDSTRDLKHYILTALSRDVISLKTHFYPNRSIKRGEVFKIARNIFDIKQTEEIEDINSNVNEILDKLLPSDNNNSGNTGNSSRDTGHSSGDTGNSSGDTGNNSGDTGDNSGNTGNSSGNTGDKNTSGTDAELQHILCALIGEC